MTREDQYNAEVVYDNVPPYIDYKDWLIQKLDTETARAENAEKERNELIKVTRDLIKKADKMMKNHRLFAGICDEEIEFEEAVNKGRGE